MNEFEKRNVPTNWLPCPENKRKVYVNEIKQLEKLDEILIEKYEMEVDKDEFVRIEDMVIALGKSLESDEFDEDSKKCLREELQAFKKYLDKNYYTTLCSNYLYGGTWGMGQVIVDDRLNFIDMIISI